MTTDTTPAAIEAILQGAEWQEPENLRRYLFPTLSALAAERDAALAERDEWKSAAIAHHPNPADHRYWEGRYRDVAAELATMRKEVERLRGAMAPFDRMACAMFARNWNKDGVALSFVERDGPIRLTFADFLAVRSALTAEPLGHGVTADDFQCRKCGGEMRPGIALAQTYVGGIPDFPGDTHSSTFSAGGRGAVIPALKCAACGWSVTADDFGGEA